MIIKDHAVENYIERVFSIDKEMAGDDLVDEAEDRIEEIVIRPDRVILNEGEDTPVYIKGAGAVPVDVGGGPEGQTVIPTTYNASTFVNKDDE